MFGTMGISELMIILAIVLIIFGAGRLPQIGEGIGKALKGFKKEVNEVPTPLAAQVQEEAHGSQPGQTQPAAAGTVESTGAGEVSSTVRSNIPHGQGSEQTPGTTASLLYNTRPEDFQGSSGSAPSRESSTVSASAQHVVSLEERAAAPSPVAGAQYPPLPSAAQAKPSSRRPSAIVNKEAVARVQAQQAALKVDAARAPASLSSDDIQKVGESVGDVLRTFRQAADDVRQSVDPEMRTIQAEMQAAQKEVKQFLEEEKDLPSGEKDSTKPV